MLTAMCDVMKEAYRRGWITTRDGNVSVRRGRANRIYMTPGGVRKNVIDLKSNPGFRTQFTFDAINSEYTITMSNIDDIQYLPIISVYLDSLVQLTQFKSKLGLVPKKIKSVCGKTQIDEQPFEEIVPEMDKSYNERVDSEKEIKDDKDEIQVDIEEDDEEVKDDVSDSPEDALDLFFGFPSIFEVPGQRFGCLGGTGLKDSVAFDGVFALKFSANAIFFNSAWM